MALRNSYLLEQVHLADEIEVFWPADKQYYKGVISQILGQGRYHVTYLDGEEEELRLANERWRFRGSAADRVSRGHATGKRKRPKGRPQVHEPEPIIIDDDDDEPPPKRARHKPITHHSNKAVPTSVRTPSISTQQSVVEIEEVPAQLPLAPVSDHRASDISEPIVSDNENEMIEEEILERGCGGDTSSAADTSELQRRDSREIISTSQHPLPHNAVKTTVAAKSTTPNNFVNSHKNHRNSFTVQSPAISTKNKSTLLIKASHSNHAKPSSPVLPAAKPPTEPSLKSPKGFTQSPSHQRPVPFKQFVPPIPKPDSNTTSATQATTAVQNNSVRAQATKLNLPAQNAQAAQIGTMAPKSQRPSTTRTSPAKASSNPVLQKKKKQISPNSKESVQARKANRQTTRRADFISKTKKNSTTDDKVNRIASNAPNTTRNNSATLMKPKPKPKSKSKAMKHRKARKNVAETGSTHKAALGHSPIALGSAEKALASAGLTEPIENDASLKEDFRNPKLSIPDIWKIEPSERKASTPKSKSKGLPSRNAANANVNAKISKVFQKQSTTSSRPLVTGKDKDIKKSEQRNTEQDFSQSPGKRVVLSSAESQVKAAPAQTPQNSTSTKSIPKKSATKQFTPPAQNKRVAAPTQSKPPAVKSVTRSGENNQQVQSDSVRGPQPAKSAEARQLDSRAKTRTPTRVSPKMKARATLPKYQQKQRPLEADKNPSFEQNKPIFERVATGSSKKDSTLKPTSEPPSDLVAGGSTVAANRLPMVSTASLNESRHPSPKVDSKERIPRNKPLASFAPCVSSFNAFQPLQTDQPKRHPQPQGPAEFSLSSSGVPDQSRRPKKALKTVFQIKAPAPSHMQTRITPVSYEISLSRTQKGQASGAVEEMNKRLRGFGAETGDRQKQSHSPWPSITKTSGTISVQSLVSSPELVTAPQNLSSNFQTNPSLMSSPQAHSTGLGEPNVASHVVGLNSGSHTNAIATSRTCAVPSVSDVPCVLAASRTYVTPNLSQMRDTHSILQVSPSVQAANSLNPTSVPMEVRGQAYTSPLKKLSPVNATLSEGLPPMGFHRSVDVSNRRGTQNGRKRTIEGNDRLEDIAKKRINVTSAHGSQGYGGVNLSSDSPAHPQASGTIGTEILHQAYGEGPAFVQRTKVFREQGASRHSILAPGMATLPSPVSRPFAPTSPAVANAHYNVHDRVMTATKILDPFSSSGYQRLAEGSAAKPAITPNTRCPLYNTPKGPRALHGPIGTQQSMVPSQRPMNVQPRARVSSFDRSEVDIDGLLFSALKSVESNFLVLGRKNEEQFQEIKESNESISRALSQLHSRIDQIEEMCSKSSNKLHKTMEQMFEKQMDEINRHTETDLREIGLVERNKLQSSFTEAIEKLTETTSNLFQCALDVIKKTVEENYGRFSTGSERQTNSSLEDRLGGCGHAVGTRSTGRDTTRLRGGNKGQNHIGVDRRFGTTVRPKNQASHERLLDSTRTLKSPQASALQSQQDEANKSDQLGLQNQRTKGWSFAEESTYLIARFVIDWLQNGECRKRAPKSEREVPVTQEWVHSTIVKCFDSILDRFKSSKSYPEAEAIITKRLSGKNVETEWLTKFGDGDVVVEKAQAIYKKWDPELFAFEWVTEKRVIVEIAKRVSASQKVVSDRNCLFADPLCRAISCLEAARKGDDFLYG
ncbi:unnamed protein product [Agarophyton chilense]|eukprot:gb/GEZJ01001643.1/.p1 GENE.gb/GEZJ01001643.1/~~gb/GEZJ01001643.1/.p1  ORF type:complete len:1676 (+),score=192.67 gb/GEZJ01001643.1/:311-5338(+)